MTASDLLAAAAAHWQLMAIAASALALAWIARRAVRSGRPDRWLSAIAVVVGYGWSAEAMWEVATIKLGVGAGFALLAFFVFESQLGTSMLRAERHKATRIRRDRHIRAAWITAAIAGGVVAFAADSPVEVVLRPVIPLLVVYQWWVGLTDEDQADDETPSSWAWTPRRLLIRLGAIRPGAGDVVTLDAQYRIARMTTLYYRHQHGVRWARRWRAGRLARLSLDASAGMKAEVQRRVAGATWFLPGDSRDATATTPVATAAATDVVTLDDSDGDTMATVGRPAVATPDDTTGDTVATPAATADHPAVATMATEPGPAAVPDVVTGDDTTTAGVATPAASSAATDDVTMSSLVTTPVAPSVATVATPRRRPARRQGTDTRTRIDAILRRTPHATPAEIASRVGVSERTVQRHLADRPPAAPVNGRIPELTTRP